MTDIQTLLNRAAIALGPVDPALAKELFVAAEKMGEPVAYEYWWPEAPRIKSLCYPGDFGELGRFTKWRNLYAAPPPAVPEGWKEAILRVRESVCAGGVGPFMQSERIIAETYLDAVEEELALLTAAKEQGK